MRDFFDYLFKEWFRQVGEALLLAFLVTTFLFTTVGVVGNSMNPTDGGTLPRGAQSLENGERVFVPKYENWLVRFGFIQWRRGEIAIVKPPEGTPNAVARFPFIGFEFRAFFIKRIVGVPGDEIKIVEGKVTVNGQVVNELHIDQFNRTYPVNYPGVCYQAGQLTKITTQQGTFAIAEVPPYLQRTVQMLTPPSADDQARSQSGEYCTTGSLKLQPGFYFVMGDNRTIGGSEDSRTFGPTPTASIAGRANAVWWPLNKIRGLPLPEGFRNSQP
jgi:signal peptidase I